MTHSKFRILFLAMFFATCFFTGCNKSDFSLEKSSRGNSVETSDKTSSSSTVDSGDPFEYGWCRHKVAEHNFSLDLPDDWKRTDPPKEVKEADGKFWAYDESNVKSGFKTNVIVTREKNPLKATDLDVMVAWNLQQMWKTRQVTSDTIVHKRLKMATEECEFFHFTCTEQLRSGVFCECTITCFLFVKGTESYIVILTSYYKQDKYYKTIFEKIGKSFRFVN